MILPVIASDRRERGNLLFSKLYEIASVVLLPRNDSITQALRGAERGLLLIFIIGGTGSF